MPDLFDEFDVESFDSWRSRIESNSKYGQFSSYYHRQGNELHPPFYTADFNQKQPVYHQLLLAAKQKSNDWLIHQDFQSGDAPDTLNKALKGGVQSIGLSLDSAKQVPTVLKQLEPVIPEYCTIHLESPEPDALNRLIDRRKSDNPLLWEGSMCWNPLRSNLEGKHYSAGSFWDLHQNLKGHFPNQKSLLIDGRIFNRNGFDSIESLALILCFSYEFFSSLNKEQLEGIQGQLMLCLSVGNSYFEEIAKFRAARLLWHNLMRQFGLQDGQIETLFIHGETSIWTQSRADQYNNLIRSTTQAMSLAIAGVQSLCVHPLDAWSGKSDDFSYRMAYNVQHLLKEESSLHKVSDPAGGSFYIESLSHSIALQAWEKFQDLVKRGGWKAWIEEKSFSARVNELKEKWTAKLDERKISMIGVNNYPPAAANEQTEVQITGHTPLHYGWRLSESLEKLQEDIAKRHAATFLLAPFGKMAWRVARLNFSANFLGVGAYPIDNLNPSRSPEDLIRAIERKKFDFLVLCADDEAYWPWCLELLERSNLKAEQLVIAGNPPKREQLEELGIRHFIHTGLALMNGLRKFTFVEKAH